MNDFELIDLKVRPLNSLLPPPEYNRARGRALASFHYDPIPPVFPYDLDAVDRSSLPSVTRRNEGEVG